MSADKVYTNTGNSATISVSGAPSFANEWAFAVGQSGGSTVPSPGGNWNNTLGLSLPTLIPVFDQFVTNNNSLSFSSTMTGASGPWAVLEAFFYTNTPVAPTVVQSKTGVGGGPGPVTLAYTSNNTLGNTSFALIQIQNNGGGPQTWKVTDTNSNTYSLIGTASTGGTGAIQVFLFAASNIIAGSNTVTFTLTAGSLGSATFTAIEFSNLTNFSTFINAQHLYEYQDNAINTRAIIATAADGTGVSSQTNNVIYWDANGASQNIFNPSANAAPPRLAVSRDYAYIYDTIGADNKKWTLQEPNFSLGSAANASGGFTTYTIDTTKPNAPTLATLAANLNQNVTISGFTNSGNNGTFQVNSATRTTVTVNNPSGVSETKSATLIAFNVTTKTGLAAPTTPITLVPPTGVGSIGRDLTAAANASGGNTTYTGVGLQDFSTGQLVVISGFTINASNNGSFTVQSSTSTTVIVNNPSGIAETTTTGLCSGSTAFYPTVFLNGWNAGQHVGSYDNGVDRGYFFGITNDRPTTFGYTNPTNALDGNPNTFTSAVFQHDHDFAGCVYSFAQPSQAITSGTLNVLSEVPVNGTDGFIQTFRSGGVWYSLDAGNTWTQIYNSPQRAKQWDNIPLPSGQDISKVQVMIFMDADDDMYHKVYLINITGAIAGTGQINLNKGRRYYAVFNNSVTQNFSDLSPVSASTGPLAGALGQPLQSIPQSSDPQADYIFILATADGGDPTVLYFVTQLPMGSTLYTDVTPEATLLANNIYQQTDINGNLLGLLNNQPPPTNGSFPTLHKGRMYLGAGSSLFFSKSLADLTTASGIIAGRYEEDWPVFNVLDISTGAEKIKGLLSDGSTLWIGTERHIRRLLGSGLLDFSTPDIIFSETGLMNQDVWQIVFLEGTPVGCMWVTPDFRCIGSDFNTYNDVGTPIQTTLNSINQAAVNAAWAQSVTLGPYNFYVLAIPTGSNTTPDTLCIYELHLRKWYIWNIAQNVLSGLFHYSLAGLPRFLTGRSDGSIGLVDPTRVQDTVAGTVTAPITSTIRTVWLDLGDPSMRKTLNEIEIETSDTATLVTIEGATTASDFTNPNIVVSNLPLSTNIFGQLKVFLSGQPAIYRFYRFTFVSTAAIPALTDTILGYFSAEVLPLNRI